MFNIQRACAWCGIVCVILFALSFMFAGFVPPPSPSLPQGDVVALYQRNASGIRIGMVLLMNCGTFLMPFVGMISHQMRRIPRLPAALTHAQTAAGSANALLIVIAAVMFMATAYRPDRPPELTYLMNDISWTFAVLPYPPAFIESVIIAVAVLADRGAKKVFPRWVGWLNILVALSFLPATLVAFVQSGPFAWNGNISFGLAGVLLVGWFIVMTWALLKAVSEEERNAT